MLPRYDQDIMHYDKLSDLTDQETRCTMLSANLWPVFIFHLTSPLEHDFRSLCAACLGIRSLDSEDNPTPRYLGSLSQCASARNLGVIPRGSNFAGRKINIRASQRFSRGNLRSGGAVALPCGHCVEAGCELYFL